MKRGGCSGLGAVEAVLLLALLGTMSLGLAHGLLSGRKGTEFVERDARVFAQARILMNRLDAASFGSGNEGDAATMDLLNLIVIENSLYGGPAAPGSYDNWDQLSEYFQGTDVTLTQLQPLSPLTWRYEQGGKTYFGPEGTWSIVVSRDLNGDGDTSDPLELATQTNEDLLRVEIQFNGRRILRTLRSRMPSE